MTSSAGHNNALGTGEVTVHAGALLVNGGITVANSIVLAGGTLNNAVGSGTSLTNALLIPWSQACQHRVKIGRSGKPGRPFCMVAKTYRAKDAEDAKVIPRNDHG